MSEIILKANATVPAVPSPGFISVHLDADGTLVSQTEDGTIVPTGSSLAGRAESLANGIRRSVVELMPAISAGTRYVMSFNMGELTNKKKALIFFSTDTAGDPTNYYQYEYPVSSGTTLVSYGSVGFQMPNGGDLARCLLLYEDYTQARRFCTFGDSGAGLTGDAEKYGPTPSNVKINAYNVTLGYYGATYSSMNIGRLVGWYNYSGTTRGPLFYGHAFSGRAVELESGWLEQSGDDTLVKLAFYNRDASATNAAYVQCFAYD